MLSEQEQVSKTGKAPKLSKPTLPISEMHQNMGVQHWPPNTLLVAKPLQLSALRLFCYDLKPSALSQSLAKTEKKQIHILTCHRALARQAETQLPGPG